MTPPLLVASEFDDHQSTADNSAPVPCWRIPIVAGAAELYTTGTPCLFRRFPVTHSPTGNKLTMKSLGSHQITPVPSRKIGNPARLGSFTIK